ncbi:MAG: hypothetical protein SH819_14625 [Cytophagales bacterium]|nr:hypothetical protein [Cytophagales bacterium]
MANNTSQHILGTSANLLGFCLFVITSLHIASPNETKIIDGLTSVTALLLTISCIFSFASIRTSNETRERRWETIADYFFVVALFGILTIIALIALNFLPQTS